MDKWSGLTSIYIREDFAYWSTWAFKSSRPSEINKYCKKTRLNLLNRRTFWRVSNKSFEDWICEITLVFNPDCKSCSVNENNYINSSKQNTNKQNINWKIKFQNAWLQSLATFPKLCTFNAFLTVEMSCLIIGMGK